LETLKNLAKPVPCGSVLEKDEVELFIAENAGFYPD